MPDLCRQFALISKFDNKRVSQWNIIFYHAMEKNSMSFTTMVNIGKQAATWVTLHAFGWAPSHASEHSPNFSEGIRKFPGKRNFFLPMKHCVIQMICKWGCVNMAAVTMELNGLGQLKHRLQRACAKQGLLDSIHIGSGVLSDHFQSLYRGA